MSFQLTKAEIALLLKGQVKLKELEKWTLHNFQLKKF